jgi:hypothetical protein
VGAELSGTPCGEPRRSVGVLVVWPAGELGPGAGGQEAGPRHAPLGPIPAGRHRILPASHSEPLQRIASLRESVWR